MKLILLTKTINNIPASDKLKYNWQIDHSPNTTGNINNLKDTNNLRSTLTNSLNYTTSDIFAKNGFVNNFGIYFKNLNATGKNDTKYKSSLQSELLNIYEFNTRFPLFPLPYGVIYCHNVLLLNPLSPVFW